MLLIITPEPVHCFSVLERGFEVQISSIGILLSRFSWLAEEFLNWA